MIIDDFFESLKDEKKYDLKGLKEVKITKTSISRWKIILSAFYHIPNNNENNLVYTNRILTSFGYPILYIRNPLETALYFCLYHNYGLKELKECISQVSPLMVSDDENKSIVTFGELQESIKSYLDDNEMTIMYTRQMTTEVQNIPASIEEFIEYIHSEKYLQGLSKVRGTALYYFKKNIYIYVQKKIEQFEKLQEKSKKIELSYDDETQEMIDALSDSLYVLIDEIPIQGSIGIEKENGEYSVIEKRDWKSDISIFNLDTSLKSRKKAQEKKIDFTYSSINFSEYCNQLLALAAIDDSLKSKVSKWAYEMFLGNRDVDRSILCLSMINNKMDINEINMVLQNCGYSSIGEKEEDYILKKFINECGLGGIDELELLGILPGSRGSDYSKNSNKILKKI